MYVYAVRGKRKSKRIGVMELQYSTARGSDMDTLVRSETPRKARMTARNAVAAVGLLKSVTCDLYGC
jgi:hypothetical protein